jgi:hypothetical protein
MHSRKLIVTHRGRLTAKYGNNGAAAIDEAVAALGSADDARGIKTHYVHLDDAGEMKKHGSKVLSKEPTANSCKKGIDKIFTALSPDYLVLLGSDDIIPHFRVPNPTFAEEGDTDPEVPTDNPYAASPSFNATSRSSYLVSDRVIGRIPDVPGSSDPTPLLNYLHAATDTQPLSVSDFALDLLVCCDIWKKSGNACVIALAREAQNLFLSPPTVEGTASFQKRYKARLQMIKCHGAALDPHFYGQRGDDFPEVLFSSSLAGKTEAGTVIGAMCCYGAAVYDPMHPAAITPGVPSIANVFLSQSASGFVGSTSIAWVGLNELACADLIVCRFLKNVMSGFSLGAALLDSKQAFLADTSKDGRNLDAAEEKTLLQFILLGDPSLRPVASREELEANASIVDEAGSAFVVGTDTESALGEIGRRYRMPHIRRPMPRATAAAERRSRRAYHFGLARQLRETLPERTLAKPLFTPAEILEADELAYLGTRRPIVHRVTRKTFQPQLTRRKSVVRTAMTAGVDGVEPDETLDREFTEETLQYYWSASTPRERVVDATIVKVETDLQGHVLRKRVLVTA